MVGVVNINGIKTCANLLGYKNVLPQEVQNIKTCSYLRSTKKKERKNKQKEEKKKKRKAEKTGNVYVKSNSYNN